MSFISTKFHEILLSGFRGVALTRKTGLMDWLTDGRVKNIIPSPTRCVGYKKNHLTSWIHQLAIQSCKCSFGDIYQNLQTECCFFCNVSIKKDPMIHYAICSDTLLTLMMLNSHVFDFTVHAWETPICLQCNSFWHSHLMGNQHFSVTRGGWQQIVQSR